MERVYQQVESQFIEGSHSSGASAGVVPYAEIAGKFVVIEEKPDGFPVALSFEAEGAPRVEADGPVLEAFSQWAQTRQARLFERLGTRFRLHGLWLQIKRTVFYDLLPDNFLESDIFDQEQGCYISTSARQALLDSMPVKSVPILRRGIASGDNDLAGLMGPSRLQSPAWQDRLQQQAERGERPAREIAHCTDESSVIGEISIKLEGQGIVKGRYRFVRAGYLEQGREGPVIANLLDVSLPA